MFDAWFKSFIIHVAGGGRRPGATSTPAPKVVSENVTECNSNDGHNGNGDICKQLEATDTKLDKKLDKIMDKLKKLDAIENKLNKLDTKVNMLEGRVKTMEKKNKEFEQSVNFVSAKCDEFQARSDEIAQLSSDMEKHKAEVAKEGKTKSKNIEKLSSDLEQHKEEMKKMSETMKAMTEEKEKLSSTVLDLQCRSMKTNLVFTGWDMETRDEDTEEILRRFLYFELGIERRIQFGNVHRFGRFVRGKGRPVVARFLHHQDSTMVLDRAHKLKDTPYGIHEQFPKVIEDRRRELYPVMRDFKRQGKTTKLVRDKLYVNGQLYRGRDDQERMDAQPSTAQVQEAEQGEH